MQMRVPRELFCAPGVHARMWRLWLVRKWRLQGQSLPCGLPQHLSSYSVHVVRVS